MPGSYHLRGDDQLWQRDFAILRIDVEVALARLSRVFGEIRRESA